MIRFYFAAISLRTSTVPGTLNIPQGQGFANFFPASSGVIFPSLIFRM